MSVRPVCRPEALHSVAPWRISQTSGRFTALTMPDMTRRDFRAAVEGGELVGWVQGSGPRVLLLHGGPGLSFNYLDPLVDEIRDGYEVASYQQRGLAPSTAMR